MPAGLEFEVNYTIFEMQKSITGNFDYDEFCSAIISHYSAVVFCSNNNDVKGRPWLKIIF